MESIYCLFRTINHDITIHVQKIKKSPRNKSKKAMRLPDRATNINSVYNAIIFFRSPSIVKNIFVSIMSEI